MAGVYQDDPAIAGPEHVHASYKGYQKFEANIEDYNSRLATLCPQIFRDGTLTIVSIS